MVTIIFCDIYDFDKIVATHNPAELIELLDKTYNTFDQMCHVHGLQKIETVGKTYMACGGLKACEKAFACKLVEKHHSMRTIEFGFDLLDYVKKKTLKTGDPFRVKIGVHTGRVISGVVGFHKP